MNVGQVVLGRGRHVQRPYYAGWEGALPRGPLPYTRRGDITGNGEGTCCPPVQHLDRKRSPSPAPSSDPLSHWKNPSSRQGLELHFSCGRQSQVNGPWCSRMAPAPHGLECAERRADGGAELLRRI